MFKQKMYHPRFGMFSKLFGPWKGEITIPGWKVKVPLSIDVKEKTRLNDLLNTLDSCWTNTDQIKNIVAKHVFDIYRFFKKMDLEEAGMTETDFESFPKVLSAEDIYLACSPEKMLIGNQIGKK